ncbi:Uncharacterised protein [Klebsiella pneumoniae]|nr:Uncharacterised protein [Klebsiella pneumoniae]SLX03311.1 Uncharacterised protein [Klebsiella pneumoniae]
MLGRYLAFPVVGIGNIADLRIHFILLQRIRPGTDRPVINVFRRSFLQHRLTILCRQNRGEVHAPVGKKRRVRLVELELDMVIIHLFHRFNQLIEAHVVEVFIVPLRHLVIRMLRIHLAQHGEQNVVGVKIAGRFEEFVAVELHPLTQSKGPGFAILRDVPLGGQRRDRRIFHRVKAHQTVIQYLRAGDERRTGAGDLRIEGLRRGF